MYHREASEAVTLYLSGGAIDPSPLEKALHVLEQMTPEKIGTARRINANIDAIERFTTMLDDIDLMSADTEVGSHNPQKLTYHNVAISVRPEIVLRNTIKGKPFIGAWKLHFSRTHPHTEESAGFVSAAVNEYCRVHLAGDAVVNPAFCKVIDIAFGKMFNGVKATKEPSLIFSAECQNIAALWPTT
jgi:hypothetical protein